MMFRMDSSSPSGSSSCSSDSSTATAGKSRRRKQPNPKRLSTMKDAKLQRLIITLEPKFIDNEWHLLIDGNFIPPSESVHTEKPKPKRRKPFYYNVSDSEDDDTSTSNGHTTTTEKHCASCSAKKTPLWRDAEDGTPLCNACGIRYKKYKVRCGNCWHIPKKDENLLQCKHCGTDLQYVNVGSW